MFAIFMAIPEETDRDMFMRRYEENYETMCKVAYKILGDQQLAEDAASDAVKKVLENYEKYDLSDAASSRSLMVKICIGKAIDKQRKMKHEILMPDIEAPDLYASPDGLIISDETVKELSDAIDSLSPELYVTFMMYFYNGVGTEEIARVDGITPDAVRKRLAKAKTLIREYMLARGYM